MLPDCFEAPGGHIKGFPCINGQLCNLLCLHGTAEFPVSTQHTLNPVHCNLCGKYKPVWDDNDRPSPLVPGIPFQNGLLRKTGSS